MGLLPHGVNSTRSEQRHEKDDSFACTATLELILLEHDLSDVSRTPHSPRSTRPSHALPGLHSTSSGCELGS